MTDGRTAADLSLWITLHTHNAVLHAETELELEIGSLDEDCGDGRAAHDAEFDLHLILQTLDHKQQQQQPWLACRLGVKISFGASANYCESGTNHLDKQEDQVPLWPGSPIP